METAQNVIKDIKFMMMVFVRRKIQVFVLNILMLTIMGKSHGKNV